MSPRARCVPAGTSIVLSFLACVLVFACAKGADEDLGDGGPTIEEAGTDSRLPFDAGSDSNVGADADDDASCTRSALINELASRSAASATAEFVELYNPGTCAMPLGGYKLSYKSSTGTPAAGITLYTFPAGSTIAAKGFLVIANTGFVGTKDATFSAASGMADDGQIALVDDGDTKVDSVGYGSVTGDYIEGTAAPQPPTAGTGSIGRKQDGVDTNNNSADFKVYATHSAGTQNP